MSFYFRIDVPDAVLATFASLHKEAAPTIQGAAPPLPVFEPAPDDDWWEPDWRDAYPGLVDPYGSEPWRHDWATWLARSVSATTVPTAALVWSVMGLWHFSCRSAFKTYPQSVLDFLGWLGPFIDPLGDPSYPRLIGLMTHDYSRRPYLLWWQEDQLSMEDLNGPNDTWG
jgi:hypothetical protein